MASATKMLSFVKPYVQASSSSSSEALGAAAGSYAAVGGADLN
jgi:hypothetical protein